MDTEKTYTIQVKSMTVDITEEQAKVYLKETNFINPELVLSWIDQGASVMVRDNFILFTNRK